MSYRADKLVIDAQTHTHRQAQATTIPKGQNWPRAIKRTQSSCCHCKQTLSVTILYVKPAFSKIVQVPIQKVGFLGAWCNYFAWRWSNTIHWKKCTIRSTYDSTRLFWRGMHDTLELYITSSLCCVLLRVCFLAMVGRYSSTLGDFRKRVFVVSGFRGWKFHSPSFVIFCVRN